MSGMKKKVSICVCILFAVLIWIQHSYVYMYFDDYGYASLSYGWTGNLKGMSYSLSDIISFLKWHYMNWGGRVLYYFFKIVIFRIGGMKLMQAVQAIIIILIGCVSGKIIACITKYDNTECIALGLGMYGVFHLKTLSDGVYWYAASVSYVWPLLPLFFGIYLLLKENESTKCKKMLSICLFFLAAFSQEQVAVLTVGFVVVYSVAKYFTTRKVTKYMMGIFGSALFGAMIVILAPGNFVRADAGDRYSEFYSKSFIRRSIENIGVILDINIGKYNLIFVIFFTVFVGAAIAVYYKSKKIAVVSGVMAVCLVFEYFSNVSAEIGLLIGCVWFLFFIIILTAYYIKTQNVTLCALLYAGICSQGMMIVSPSISTRCHVMMEFVLHIILAECIIRLLKTSKNIVVYIGTISLLGYAVANMTYIMLGYQKNYEINEINNYKLIEASKKVKVGDELEEIVLYKLYDDDYANCMPYFDNFDYIEYWMKNYYELRQDVVFRWNNIEESSSFQMIDGEYYADHWLGKRVVFLCDSEENKKVTLTVNNVGEAKQQKLYCIVGETKTVFEISEENNIVEIEIPKGKNELIIEAEKTFRPGNGDERELSVNLEVSYE